LVKTKANSGGDGRKIMSSRPTWATWPDPRPKRETETNIRQNLSRKSLAGHSDKRLLPGLGRTLTLVILATQVPEIRRIMV
jgi:hypothetical protein